MDENLMSMDTLVDPFVLKVLITITGLIEKLLKKSLIFIIKVDIGL